MDTPEPKREMQAPVQGPWGPWEVVGIEIRDGFTVQIRKRRRHWFDGDRWCEDEEVECVYIYS